MFPIFIDSPSVRTTNRRRPNSPPRPVSPKPPESPRPSALGSPSPPSRAPPRRTPRPRANRFPSLSLPPLSSTLQRRARRLTRAAVSDIPARPTGVVFGFGVGRVPRECQANGRGRASSLFERPPGMSRFARGCFFRYFFGARLARGFHRARRRRGASSLETRTSAPSSARSLVARNASVGAILGEKPRRSKRERRRSPRGFLRAPSAARRLRSRRRRRYESTRARDPKRRGDSSTRETRGEVWSTPPVASRRARENTSSADSAAAGAARRVRLRRESRRATPIATWRTRGEPRGAAWTFSRIGPRDDRRIRPIARLGRRE